MYQCEKDLKFIDFYIRKNGKYKRPCKECHKNRNKKYYIKNNEEIKKRVHNNNICNPIKEIGYTIKNVVPCCNICNKMKLTYGFDFFVNHCSKVYKNLKYIHD